MQLVAADICCFCCDRSGVFPVFPFISQKSALSLRQFFRRQAKNPLVGNGGFVVSFVSSIGCGALAEERSKAEAVFGAVGEETAEVFFIRSAGFGVFTMTDTAVDQPGQIAV